jgi:hypothetical protein
MPLPSSLLLHALCLPAMAVHAAEPAAFPPARKTQECTPRTGWPHFFSKARAEGEVHVAYLGGSITAQPGYRVKSLEHFRSTYPKATFKEINAAIGGTGSDLGAYRIEHDVFGGKPDLLFVEFAVNDGGTAPEEIVRAMEGIVRKTWKQFPACDICFVYTFTESLLPELQAGRLNRSAATMEVVADHYGIPSIHMGLEAVRLETEGKLLMRAPEATLERVSGDALNKSAPVSTGPDGKIPFSQDGVHPYLNTGHQLYVEAVIRSLPKLEGYSPAPHSLPAPLDLLNYENTAMVPLEKVTKTGPWTQLPADSSLSTKFSNRIGTLWKAEPGAELSFKFKGHTAKLYDILGPDCGKLSVSIDGKVSERQRFDPYSTYSRLGTFTVGSELAPSSVHEVRIRVLADPLDKGQILFERNRGDFAKNPQKYEPHFWYAGALLLSGELVP